MGLSFWGIRTPVYFLCVLLSSDTGFTLPNCMKLGKGANKCNFLGYRKLENVNQKKTDNKQVFTKRNCLLFDVCPPPDRISLSLRQNVLKGSTSFFALRSHFSHINSTNKSWANHQTTDNIFYQKKSLIYVKKMKQWVFRKKIQLHINITLPQERPFYTSKY